MEPAPSPAPRSGRQRARRRACARWLTALLLGGLPAACSDDAPEGEGGPEPLFPASYASTYTEVRACRSSTEHDFARVRVLADPAATPPYLGRDADFPEGSIVLKEEYDVDDTACAGDIVRWTVMQRLPTGSSPETLGWRWQDVDATRRVKTQDEPRCIGCHTTCGVPPDGYQGTCTVVGATDGAFR